MEHCMHITDYSRSGANPPDAVVTCCHCGGSAETLLLEMKPLGDLHGEQVSQEIQVVVEDPKNPLGSECQSSRV